MYDEHSRNTFLFRNGFTARDVRPYLRYGSVFDNQSAVTVRSAFLQNKHYMNAFYHEGYTVLEMEAGPFLSACYELVHPTRIPHDEIVSNLIFLLAAGYTLLRQEHVRIDVVLGRFSKRTQIKVEAVCLALFLFPFCFEVVGLVWPLVVRAYVSGEMSSNAGGLIRWPVYALVPIGFTLLFLQGVSELIKRVAFLMGLIDDPTKKVQAKTAEEELAEAIRAQAEGKKA